MASAATTPACAMSLAVDKLSSQSRSPVSASFSTVPVKRFQCLHLNCVATQTLAVAAPEKINGLNEELVELLEAEAVENQAEIHTLLAELCDSGVAEIGVKVGPHFELRVKRSTKPAVAAVAAAPAANPAASPAAQPAAPAPVASKKASTSPPKVSPLMSKAVVYEELQKDAADNGFVFVNSPKVGTFRKSKLVKGKSGSPLCSEGGTVKQGQVVCFLEQLGTHSPVEADVDGEVVQVLFEDGVPVGYGDPLIVVKPKKP